MRVIKHGVFSILLLCLLTTLGIAQDSEILMPNLVGLNAPQATSILHQNNLRLGKQTIDITTPPDGVEWGTIRAQSIAAGDSVGSATVVDVTIAQPANIRFFYDDNDMTLINQTGLPIPLSHLRITGMGGDSPVLDGTRWQISAIPAGGCVQIWSIGRAAPKAITGCGEISAWFSSTLDSSVYVWTQTAGVESFTVWQADRPLMTCPAAHANSQDDPLICDAHWPPIPAPEQGGFMYLAYTTNALSVRNPATDVWMSLAAPLISATGETWALSERTRYETVLEVVFFPDSEVLSQLAPDECLILRDSQTPLAAPPESCGLVVAEGVVDSPFWRSDFALLGSDGERRTCKASTPDKLTVCILQQ